MKHLVTKKQREEIYTEEIFFIALGIILINIKLSSGVQFLLNRLNSTLFLFVLKSVSQKKRCSDAE